MTPFLKSVLPYGISQGNFKTNIKKWVKNFLPSFVVERIIENNRNKNFTSEFLKNNYVSDLTENEKWSILSVLLFLERRQNEVNYLEIGIYAGGTIKFLQENTFKTHFTGIDLFEDFIPESGNTHIWKNYSIGQVWDVLGKQRVMLFKGDSVKVLTELRSKSQKFDMVFIDGNHTYNATKADFNNVIPLLNHGGYIVFHNCSPGLTQEDKYYIRLDGGPWMLTFELKDDTRFRLIEKVDRIKLFQYFGN